MNVLLIHNYYQQAGGEDQVFAAEANLLKENGHRVVQYTVHNDVIHDYSKLRLARSMFWNSQTYQEISNLIQEHRPDIAHFHNTFPLVSPGCYYAAQSHGVPVVQTLHNFRLFCLNSNFIRNGQVCEDCLHKVIPWPGILHACYRDSTLTSAGLAAMLTFHRFRKTWLRKVNMFITLTEFSRSKFISSGLPENKVIVKGNFISPDPGYSISPPQGRYALFVGRLSTEKGVKTLLEGWERLQNASLPYSLIIVGDGPLAEMVQSFVEQCANITWLGKKTRSEIFTLMKDASFLVFPSICYENLPMTILEAYAVGLPIVSSNHGSMASLVKDRYTGVHFCSGDPEDMARKVEWAFSNPKILQSMREHCRREYEEKYSAKTNHDRLLSIYQRILDSQVCPVHIP
ncbi:glycosyltransferase family 4 protein [Candidatus Nitrospira salsa]|nr:MAG: glycosyl transferase family 1 [Nitrospirales bacterium]